MIEILYFDGCPHYERTLELARDVVGEMGLDVDIRDVPVGSAAEAEEMRFLGSPSVRVNGRDIEPEARERIDFALGCRIYSGGGIPPKELLVAALREA